jgi:hypothetical protein
VSGAISGEPSAEGQTPRAETLVIIQPNYIPWIGYFDLIDRAELCVWYDDVQYTKND